MCIYNQSNNFQSGNLNRNSGLNNEEYELLSKIYKSIESNDIESIKSLTSDLIALQSSSEQIQILQDSINSLL